MYFLEKEKVQFRDFERMKDSESPFGAHTLHCINGDVEICIEPLFFLSVYVAVYDKEQNLLLPKEKIVLGELESFLQIPDHIEKIMNKVNIMISYFEIKGVE